MEYSAATALNRASPAQSSSKCRPLRSSTSPKPCARKHTHALTRIKKLFHKHERLKSWSCLYTDSGLYIQAILFWSCNLFTSLAKHAAKVPLRRAQINNAKAENFIASKRRIAKLKLWKDAWPKRCLHDTLTLFYWFECVLEHVVSLNFAVCNVSATTCI